MLLGASVLPHNSLEARGIFAPEGHEVGSQVLIVPPIGLQVLGWIHAVGV